MGVSPRTIAGRGSNSLTPAGREYLEREQAKLAAAPHAIGLVLEMS